MTFLKKYDIKILNTVKWQVKEGNILENSRDRKNNENS